MSPLRYGVGVDIYVPSLLTCVAVVEVAVVVLRLRGRAVEWPQVKHAPVVDVEGLAEEARGQGQDEGQGYGIHYNRIRDLMFLLFFLRSGTSIAASFNYHL